MAFDSNASNLVAEDTNGYSDVFVHDRQTGVTTRVSVSSDGAQANSYSFNPGLSGDGRFVAFDSNASNLVAGDTNNVNDIFVHDRQTGETSRVSVSSSGIQGNGGVGDLAISADSRFVAFESDASNLIAGDTNGTKDIFVHDRQTGETSRVSVSSDGVQGSDSSWSPDLSADGRFVAFYSNASNLVAEDTNGLGDIFIHDRQTGATSLVSVSSSGAQGNYSSHWPATSADGRFVAFQSAASNFVDEDTNYYHDIFVHDRQTGATSRVSVSSGGVQGNMDSYELAISADGRFVAFYSDASNLVVGDTNSVKDIFVHDRQTGQTSRVSVSSGGVQGNSASRRPDLSADGRFVTFGSDASNLIPEDTNGTEDIFVHVRETPPTTFTISGRIVDQADDPVSSVTICTHTSVCGTTGPLGYYTIANLPSGSYTLTPSKPRFSFSPTSRTIDLQSNVSDANFVGTDLDLELAQRHAPIVRMHISDRMIPMSVDVALEHAKCLKIQPGHFANCEPVYPIDTKVLALPEWIDTIDAYIDFNGDPHSTDDEGSQYYWDSHIRNLVRNNPVTYAHVVGPIPPSGRWAIQYFLYYYYNNHWATRHEGDWEMIQVELGPDEEPEYVIYTQHGKPSKREWDDVRRIGDDHPIVYPARGSHASYFQPGVYHLYGSDWTADDLLNDQFSPVPDLVTEETDRWVQFKGHWGEKDFRGQYWSGWASSPAVEETRWGDPLEWSNNAPFDEFAEHNKGKLIIRTSRFCHIGILDRTTGQRWGWIDGVQYDEIDLIELIRNDELQIDSIILHGSFDEFQEKYDLFWGECTLFNYPNQLVHAIDASSQLAVVEYVDNETTDLVTLTYGVPTGWNTETSIAQISLSSMVAPELEVDIDGNGSIDVTQPAFNIDQAPLYPVPAANFAANPLSGGGPLTVNFFDDSTGYPTDWLWNFGDDQTSTEPSPTHTYLNAGTYTVSLTVSNPSGSDSETKTGYVTVTAGPTANFSADTTSGSPPLVVNFINTSIGQPTSYLWNFGDGQTSTTSNPTHTYYSPGNYTVSLTVTNAAGSDIEVKTAYIHVQMGPLLFFPYVSSTAWTNK